MTNIIRNFIDKVWTPLPPGVKNAKIQENSEKNRVPPGARGTLYNHFRALGAPR